MKLKRTFSGLMVLGLLVGATAWAADEGKIDLEKIKCIVASGKAANPEKSAEFEKGKVFFCCDGCKGKFEQDKEKYAAKGHQQLVATKQYKQKACPFSGGDVDPAKTTKINGVEVGFCCGNCLAKAEGVEGDEQVELVFGKKSFEKGFELVKKEKE
jgi:YHS domain-containing protein